MNDQQHPRTSRYLVQTTDVIQDMRVNVSEEHTGKVIWYKERFLSDTEIIENVVHNPTTTVQWTIHRPRLRGWYIRLRSPVFPPGVFIPLTPVPASSPLYADAAITFSSRTNVPFPDPPRLRTSTHETQFTLSDDEEDAKTIRNVDTHHSYPPTPTASSSSTKLPQIHTQNQTQITQFLLSPSSQPSHPHQNQNNNNRGLLARAYSLFRSSAPNASGSSFSLCRVVPPFHSSLSGTTSPPPYASTSSVSLPPASSTTHIHPTPSLSSPSLYPPLLTFTDHTPFLTFRCVSGLLELDQAEATRMGVDPGFWITLALVYLEFLEDRESYLAASSD